MYQKLKEERERSKVWTRGGSKDYWAYTICGGCYNMCGMRVHVVDGCPVVVEGVAESDLGGQGGLCGKGVATLMDYHDPNRCNYPVKRTNPKKGLHEDPKWQRISWDEAMDTIAEKMKATMAKDPRAVVYGYTPGQGNYGPLALIGFYNAYGSPNLSSGGPGIQCGASGHHFCALIHGAWDILPDYRYNNFLLRCGGNEGVGGGRMAATAIRQFAQARDRGQRTVVMDPIGYLAGGKAAEWIPILPGTDLAVLLSIANIIVNETGVYDKEFIRHKTNGSYLIGEDRKFVRNEENQKPLLWDEKDGAAKTYDDPSLTQPTLEGEYTVNGVKCQPAFQLLKEHLKQYHPDWASKISTVPEDRIRRLAKELVEEAKIGSTIEIDGVKVPYRPSGLCGYKGFQGHQNGFHQYGAMCLINSLLGNQDVAGGILGSGTVRSLGHPEFGNPRFEPYATHDGMLTVSAWPSRLRPWPPREPKGPECLNLTDLFADSIFSPYPYPEDWDEIWTKAGRPYEPEICNYYGCNVVMNLHNPEIVGNFLKKVPFTWVITTTHNETTEGFADIVLPENHFIEWLEPICSTGYYYNYPIGMEKWCFHLRMPCVAPKYERRETMDIYFDLAERLGIRDKFNKWLDPFLSTLGCLYEHERRAIESGEILEDKLKESPIVKPEEGISWQEMTDRTLKHSFGEERGLDWFREEGYISWDKKPEECYWRWFVNVRVPIYYENHEHTRPKLKELAEKVGIYFDWDQWTPLISYFPDVIYTEESWDGSEHDLVAISPRHGLHLYRTSVGNPFVDAMSKENPYIYNWVMHEETAKKKGINEGDMICVENLQGNRVEGRVKLSKLIHPNVVGALGLGCWAKGKPIAQGKGVNFNVLLRSDHKRICPITSSFETGARVKACRVEAAE
ncbi:molybdopterin-dependent oxidoreductase [Chloroflexota bacterium]